MTSFGILSSHMLQHIALMNVLVPLVVFGLPQRWCPTRLWRTWPWATAAQVILLWAWHSPSLLPSAIANPPIMLAMHASLAVSAAWFWLAIANMPRNGGWRAMFALLVTGKLFCLLGALLVFAPNVLFHFGPTAHAHHGAVGASGINDQQLAGIIMLMACPLTYIAVAIVMAGRWFLRLEADQALHA